MKAGPIKQQTAPPLMMYGADAAKLDQLGWDAHGLFWAAQMWLITGHNEHQMLVPKNKLEKAANRRRSLKVLEAAAAELVEEGIWLDGDEHWVVVLHHQPPIDDWRNPVLRARWLRDKNLKRDTDLLQRIKDRDRLLCRYCGARTRWDGDQKSKLSGTYDHIDPDGDNSFENVVIACRHCNCTLKKDRTLEHAGMSLYRPGTTAEDISAGRARPIGAAAGAHANAPDRRARSDPEPPEEGDPPDPDLIQIGSGSRPDSPCAPARLRTDPDQNRIGSGSDQPAEGGCSTAPVFPFVDDEGVTHL
ncbi:MAG: HNH endonuclease signature motif containing protein [Actinomycetota bacterium]|nr:HNH endonuclease signature motif containing protein [Actinomycetota bacterium]